MSFRIKPLETPDHHSFFYKKRFTDVTLLPIEDRVKLYAIQSRQALNRYKKKYSLISPSDDFEEERSYSRFALDPSNPEERKLYDKLMKYTVKREYVDDEGRALKKWQIHRLNREILQEITNFILPKLSQTPEARQQRDDYVKTFEGSLDVSFPPLYNIEYDPKFRKEDMDFIQLYFRPESDYTLSPGVRLLLDSDKIEEYSKKDI